MCKYSVPQKFWISGGVCSIIADIVGSEGSECGLANWLCLDWRTLTKAAWKISGNTGNAWNITTSNCGIVEGQRGS